MKNAINMETFKLKIHSAVDLITNSSTEIFTMSGGCVEPLKELVKEMLVTFDKGYLDFDDLFYCGVFADDYIYGESTLYPDDAPNVEELIQDILHGKIEKPLWMTEVEEEYDDRYVETFLLIEAKEGKYTKLAKRLLDFLYSPDHDAQYH